MSKLGQENLALTQDDFGSPEVFEPTVSKDEKPTLKMGIVQPKYCPHGIDLNIATCHRCDGTAIYTEQDTHTYSNEYCVNCDSSYHSYGCMASKDAPKPLVPEQGSLDAQLEMLYRPTKNDTGETIYAFKSDLMDLIEQDRERAVREARVDERDKALSDINKLDGTVFDTDEHTNRVYNPYIVYHNARIENLTQERSESV